MKSNKMATRLFQWMFVFAFMALGIGNLWAATKLTTSTCPTLGAGTANNPYQISSLAHLGWLSDNVSSATWNAPTVYYRVTKNIAAGSTASRNDGGTGNKTKEGFKPIGTEATPFVAKFEGGKCSISGLTINRPGESYVGLFGYVGSDAQITSLTLLGGSVKGGECVGSLAGYSAGAIANCRVTCKVSGVACVGGLVGQMDSAIAVSGCTALGQVTGSEDYVGGLIGDSATSITGCLASGKVTGMSYVGGLTGNNNADITSSHATGAVTGYYDQVGGVVGYSETATFTDVHATGKVTGFVHTGGLIGSIYKVTISGCSAKGAVTGLNDVGGLIGYSYVSDVTDVSFATGKVMGYGYYTGGLIGYSCDDSVTGGCFAKGVVVSKEYYTGGLIGGSESCTITDCYATGKVTGQNCVGGLIGDDYYSTIKDCDASGKITGANDVGGLIGWCYQTPTVQSCSATGSVVGLAYCGGLIGNCIAIVTDCHASGSVIGSSWVGGLCGTMGTSKIISCTATGAATGDLYVGGLVGYATGYSTTYGAITNSSCSGKVTGDAYVGGLVGNANCQNITGCTALGVVTGATYVGGLVGELDGDYTMLYTTHQHGYVVESSAMGKVTGTDMYTGGLIGYMENADVNKSYATGAVKGVYGVGGLIGSSSGYNDGTQQYGTVTNCYARGMVQGNDCVAGLIGYNQESKSSYPNTTAAIDACYSTGKIVCKGDIVGGLVAVDTGALATDSYWNITTAGGITTSAGGDDATTAEMTASSVLATWGWDTSVWAWSAPINNGYPYLQ